MTIQSEIDYYQHREAVERAAASAAPDLAIHDAHFVLAERYADLVYSLSERAFEDADIIRIPAGH